MFGLFRHQTSSWSQSSLEVESDGAACLVSLTAGQLIVADVQMVIAVPEVRHLCLEEGDEFLILACDGIWDVLSNQEVLSCHP